MYCQYSSYPRGKCKGIVVGKIFHLQFGKQEIFYCSEHLPGCDWCYRSNVSLVFVDKEYICEGCFRFHHNPWGDHSGIEMIEKKLREHQATLVPMPAPRPRLLGPASAPQPVLSPAARARIDLMLT